MKSVRVNYTEDGRVNLQGYLWDAEIVFRGEKKRPAVLICPGGAYLYCAAREMDPIAMAFAAKGYHAFVLQYSCGEYAKNFQPMKEVDWAIQTIRGHAGEWNVVKDQLTIAGFSAGGHLALAGALRTEHKADAMILGYPVADTFLLDGENVANDPLVKSLCAKAVITKEDLEAIDMLHYVTEDAPPMFLFNTFEDEQLARGHSLGLANRYSELNLPFEYHLFQKGLHGLSMADETTENGNEQANQPHVARWFPMALEWLKEINK